MLHISETNCVCTFTWYSTGCLSETQYIEMIDAVESIATHEAKLYNARHDGLSVTSTQDLSQVPPAFCKQLARRLETEYGVELSVEELRGFRTLELLGHEIYEELEEARCDDLFPQ